MARIYYSIFRNLPAGSGSILNVSTIAALHWFLCMYVGQEYCILKFLLSRTNWIFYFKEFPLSFVHHLGDNPIYIQPRVRTAS